MSAISIWQVYYYLILNLDFHLTNPYYFQHNRYFLQQFTIIIYNELHANCIAGVLYCPCNKSDLKMQSLKQNLPR